MDKLSRLVSIYDLSSAVGLENLAYSMEIGETITVSDASLGSHSRASHAYIITTKSKKHSLTWFAPIDCDADDVESTRAELYGQVTVHTILIALTNIFGVLSGEVAVYSDNSDSLCKNVVDLRKVSFSRVFRPNINLKLQIDSMQKSIKPFNIVLIHIKGHQDKDENFEFENAPLSVQCNIEMMRMPRHSSDHTEESLNLRNKHDHYQ